GAGRRRRRGPRPVARGGRGRGGHDGGGPGRPPGAGRGTVPRDPGAEAGRGAGRAGEPGDGGRGGGDAREDDDHGDDDGDPGGGRPGSDRVRGRAGAGVVERAAWRVGQPLRGRGRRVRPLVPDAAAGRGGGHDDRGRPSGHLRDARGGRGGV